MKMDKKLHFAAGLVIALIIAMPVYHESKYSLFCGLWSCLSVVVAGLVKEYTDYCHTKVWDWRDFAATLIGGIVVVLLILGLHYGKG